jgi:hypothetical protein
MSHRLRHRVRDTCLTACVFDYVFNVTRLIPCVAISRHLTWRAYAVRYTVRYPVRIMGACIRCGMVCHMVCISYEAWRVSLDTFFTSCLPHADLKSHGMRYGITAFCEPPGRMSLTTEPTAF